VTDVDEIGFGLTASVDRFVQHEHCECEAVCVCDAEVVVLVAILAQLP